MLPTKKLLLVLAFFCTPAAIYAADPNIIPKGTSIKVHVLEPVSSATAKLADLVQMEVAEDVKVDGKVVIPKGSKAGGFIVEAQSGQFWSLGRLGVYVGSVATPAGLRVPTHGLLEVSATREAKQAVITIDNAILGQTDLDIPLDQTIDLAASSTTVE